MRPCNFMRSSKYQLCNFLLDLKARLPNSRISASMSFSVFFTLVKFQMLLTKTEFFSRIRSMVN